jgi:glycosyltransferase involved in cell wall biosynthesis
MTTESSAPTSAPTSDRPRLLYLAFYFPPTRASGVYRSRATANHFAAAGWDVTVVTPQREFFTHAIKSFDPSLEATVRDDVRVERVAFPGRPWERDIRRFSRFRGNFPGASKMLNTWAENRFFPEHYSPWIPRVVRRAVQLHRRSPFDVVLATGNPFSVFAAAWAIHRLTRVPYVVDYRDSWTLDLFQDAPAFPPEHAAWGWERRILDRATRVVFVNDALRHWHAERYPQVAGRMRVVQNGFEPDFLGDLPVPAPPGERPPRFGYVGTMTTHVPIEEFVAGWRLARAAPGLADAVAEVHGHLGFFPASARNLRHRLPLREDVGISYAGAVPKAQVRAVYESLDVLLLILAGARYVTSGKVYEYMATGKPIVSVHDPECAAREALEGYPLWFPVRDLTAEAVRDALVDAAAAARTLSPETVALARKHASRFTRDAQLHPFELELRSLVDG